MSEKIILSKDVENLGNKGDVLVVKSGYARNFLIPKNYAFPWSEKVEKQTENIRKKRAELEAKKEADAKSLQEAFASQVFVINKKITKNNKLYGSVTKSDVIDVISKGHDFEFNPDKLVFDENIKTPGSYVGKITLYPGVVAEIKILVEAAKE